MNRSAIHLLGALLFASLSVGCGNDPGDDRGDAAQPSAPTANAAHVTKAAAGQNDEPANTTKAPRADVEADDGAAARRRRFESRPAIEPVPTLPKVWRSAVATAEARTTRSLHEVFTRIDRTAPSERRELQLRLFGPDAAVDDKVRRLLTALRVPGLPPKVFPTEIVTDGALGWSIDLQRYKAPAGAPRETIATIVWSRTAPDPAPETKPCKKPPAVKPAPGTPAWMKRLTNARSTRRLVSAALEREPGSTRWTSRMLYRNGEARDEAVRHFSKAAKRAGFVREGEAEGLSQIWRRAKDGAQLSWRNDSSTLQLGCPIAGPVLRLRLDIGSGAR